MQKQQLIILDKIDPNQLPELANFKEKGIALLKGCFFIKIEDNSTYEIAKKHRTALKSYRTDVQKSEKAIKDKINSFKNKVKIVSAELIEITQIAENKQQSEIDAWEEKKEQERKEKAIAEQQRIDGIKTKISDYVASWKEAFSFMVFGSIKEVSDNFHESNANFDKTSLQEFDVLFDREVSTLAELLDSKISTLKEQEQIRVDNLLIQEKNAESSHIQEWQSTWNANIDCLSFDNITAVQALFNVGKLANLKHYVSAYEEIYLSTEKRLNSQIEFVSKAEEQRIAQEKLNQEKKKFEEKQDEAKFKERKNILFDEGYWEIFFKAEANENDEIAKSKLVAYSEDDFDKFVDAVKKARTPVEAIEVVGEEEVVELPALEESENKNTSIQIGKTEFLGVQYTDEKGMKTIVEPSDSVKKEVEQILNSETQEVEFEEVVSLEVADQYQTLFNFFSQEHGLTLTITEMDEIIHQVGEFHNQFKNK